MGHGHTCKDTLTKCEGKCRSLYNATFNHSKLKGNHLAMLQLSREYMLSFPCTHNCFSRLLILWQSKVKYWSNIERTTWHGWRVEAVAEYYFSRLKHRRDKIQYWYDENAMLNTGHLFRRLIVKRAVIFIWMFLDSSMCELSPCCWAKQRHPRNNTAGLYRSHRSLGGVTTLWILH